MNFPSLTVLINDLVRGRLPWAEAAVSVDGKAVYGYSAGFADPENGIPYERGSRGMYYSLTKIVTSACAMKLMEEELLAPDAYLHELLPEFGVLKTVSGESARVTVRQLLSMSSGFSYDRKCFSGRSASASLREALRPLTETPLSFTPGTHWLYGFGMDVLGAVLEQVSGIPAARLIRQKLFAPFGITGPKFFHEGIDPASIPPLFITAQDGYERIPLDTKPMPSPLAFSGGAGLTGNASDMARFLSILSAGRVIGEATLDLMTRNTLTPASRADCFWPSLKGYGYGLGVRTLTDAATSPSPAGEFGWGGQAGSYALCDRERRLGFCFMTHVVGQSETDLFKLLRNTLYEDLNRDDSGC